MLTMRPALVLCCALLACSRSEPPATASSATAAPAPDATQAPAVPPPAELDLRSIELDTAPDPDANPRDWVACKGGEVVDGTRRFVPCNAESKTWVNPSKDEVLLVVSAVHAREVRALGRRATFVEDRARLKIPLRVAMASLPASTIGLETTLTIPLEIDHERGVARGDLVISTPRVHELLLSALEGPLRFPEDPAPTGQPIGPDTPVLYVGPEPEALPASPDLALSSVEVFAIDIGKPVHLAPCPATRGPRVSRPIELLVVERRTGRTIGQRRWPGAITPCSEADPHALAPPTPQSIAASVRRLLTEQDTTRWTEPPLESEAVVGATDPLSGLDDLPRALLSKPANKAALHALWRLPPLDPNSDDLATADVLGQVGAHPGLTYRLARGRLAAVSLGKNSPPLPALAPLAALPRTPEALLEALGRPSAATAAAISWRLDAGDWQLGLACVLDGPRCDRLELTWDNQAGASRAAFVPPFDVASLPPGNPEQIRRLKSFLGLGPDADRAALHRVLGPPQGPVTSDADGLEVHSFGASLGALVDAKTGLVQEVWIVGSEGRHRLKSKNLDDPLIALIGEPMEAAARMLGRPSKIGPGFISWTIDEGPLTIYAELQCPADDGYRCNELDVGWLFGEDPHDGGDVAPH